jgi:hypothetical protein
MITASNVRYMIDIPVEHMKAIAVENKIKGYEITGVKFLGMTNGSEFCYTIVHAVKGGTDSAKMFLKYDPTRDRVIANIG